MRRTQRSATVVFPPLSRSCFRKPPWNPGRSDFPSPVLTSTLAHFQAEAFPPDGRFKHWPAYTPHVTVYSCPCHGSMNAARIQHCVWVPSRSLAAECPEPLCQAWVLPTPGCLRETPRRALPLLHRSYGLTRQSMHLLTFSASTLYARSSQVAASPCWCMDLPDFISAILAEVPGPLPRGVPPVRLPVSSRRASASP